MPLPPHGTRLQPPSPAPSLPPPPSFPPSHSPAHPPTTHPPTSPRRHQVTYDYGADDAWIALTKHCAEAREPQYTYRLCLFDKAAQVDNNAGHETNLGQWRGFEKGYTEVRRGGVGWWGGCLGEAARGAPPAPPMQGPGPAAQPRCVAGPWNSRPPPLTLPPPPRQGVFENGDWCHQAPARSMRVTFQCGLEESAWGGSEPATCAYAAAMATPAACRQEDLQALEDRLAALIKEEAELAKEIAEEEAARQAAFRAHAAAAAAKDEL
jgi:hypothetical protein